MKNQKYFRLAACFLAAFFLWTAAVKFMDVQPIGPEDSSVGLAAINLFVHRLTGVHMALYTITDWLGLIPLAFVISFALLGIIQWIERKHILKVDHTVLVLGGFYIIVFAVYVLFEVFVVNFRPVLIAGVLEASYPSSTTMLVMCVMPTAIMQLNTHIKNKAFRQFVSAVIWVFIVFMVLGRLVSGVHWFSDIVGGILLSAGLVLMYRSTSSLKP